MSVAVCVRGFFLFCFVLRDMVNKASDNGAQDFATMMIETRKTRETLDVS